MGEVVKLIRGRSKRGKAIPKSIECKDCGEDIETARLQALNDGMAVTRCISCARAFERRLNRDLEAVRDYQAVRIIR
jgi:RNA polymerase-binding transcription factor DksA